MDHDDEGARFGLMCITTMPIANILAIEDRHLENLDPAAQRGWIARVEHVLKGELSSG